MDEVPTHDPNATPPRPDPSLAYEPPAHAVSVQDQNWATAAHLSSLVTVGSGLGFLGPLVVLLAAGQRSPFVRRHAVEALNFNLSVLLAAIVSGILTVILIGFLLLLLLFIGYVAGTIAGAVAASRGQEYRYPLTIRFVR